MSWLSVVARRCSQSRDPTPRPSVAAKVATQKSRPDAAAQRRGLRQLDERVMRFINAVGMARTLSCLVLVPQLPMLVEALKPSIEYWRSMPFAGGLRD